MKVFKATVLIFILLIGGVPATTASITGDQYITPPIVLHSDASANFTQAAIATDSNGNLHTVSVRDGLHIYYSMLSSRGETLIDATQISSAGLHKIWHPDMAIDTNDKVHIVWANKAGQHRIMYTALNPWNAPMDG